MPLHNYFYVQVYHVYPRNKTDVDIRRCHTRYARSLFAGNGIRTRDISITSPPPITKYNT